jgi:hypothetical protein
VIYNVVTFDPVPLYIICVRLGPSIPGVYVNPGFWTPKIRVWQSNPVQPMKAEDPQILEGHPVSTSEKKKAWELPEGAIVLEGILVSPQAMDKQEHPESSQDPRRSCLSPSPWRRFQHRPVRSKKKLQALPPSEELQEPVQLEEEFNPVLPSQLPPEEVINISSLLTHPGDVSDWSCAPA